MAVTKLSKMREWVALTLRNPVEALDRVATVVDVQSDRWFVTPPAYPKVPFEEVRDRILGVMPGNFSDELPAVEAAVRERKDELSGAPIKQIHNADFALARLCYLAVRVARPTIVLETGVAYGVTSAFILSALARNGDGTLHSVDLPPLGRDVDQYVGALVPEEVRGRWHLHRGVAKRVVPELAARLGRIDMFVHDSLHTYRNIKMELDSVTPHLSPGAIVLADDIDENPAFLEWSANRPLRYSGVVQEEEKASLLGVALMP